jgi:hypothetical protein
MRRQKFLPLTWVLRCKHTPDGEIKKLKAHLCVQGDLQEGLFDTFAPVVSWTSVQIFFILTMMTSWETCSIDFLNAFVQATLKEPIWIHLPWGFRTAGPAKTYLCYGISEAPLIWYEHLLKALLNLGLKQCQQDQCLFYRANFLTVLYVDDAGIAAPGAKYINEFITSLETKGFTLTKMAPSASSLASSSLKTKKSGPLH